MARISEVEIPTLLFDEQGSDPTTPGTDLWRLYAKSDGIYAINDAGTVVGPFGGGGGAGSNPLIYEDELSSDTATVQVRSLPTTRKSLRVEVIARSSRADVIDQMCIRLGSSNTIDSGSNYDRFSYDWRQTSSFLSAVTRDQAQTSGELGRFGWPGNSITDAANTWGLGYLDIGDYAGSKFKTGISFAGHASGDTASTDPPRIAHATFRWRSTDPINSFDLFFTNGNFRSGSIIRVFGYGETL